MTLVDTNVLLDLTTDDPIWADWSLHHLEAASLLGPILINDIIYAELSIRYQRIEGLEAMLRTARIEVAPIAREALFLAGKVFQQYRARGGIRTGVLPDFFIGAHAELTGWKLATRDVERISKYFPAAVLLTP